MLLNVEKIKAVMATMFSVNLKMAAIQGTFVNGISERKWEMFVTNT